MSEDNKARLREFIDTVLTAGEIDATGDYSHGDVVEEVPFAGQGPGLHGHAHTAAPKPFAIPAPMPFDAPVTMATLPVNWLICILLSQRYQLDNY